MRITVITAVYEGAATIAACRASVASQIHEDREHLIIDGASRDGTLAILARDDLDGPDLVVCSQPDDGVYDAFNRGLAQASGDVVGFLGADDTLAHRRVLSRIAACLADPAIAAVHADLRYVDRTSGREAQRWWRGPTSAARGLALGLAPAHPTFYARRACYRHLGGYDLRFPRAADHELLARWCLRHRLPTRYVPETWVHMRSGGLTNASACGILAQNLEGAFALLRHHRLPLPLPPLLKLAERWRQRLRLRCG